MSNSMINKPHKERNTENIIYTNDIRMLRCYDKRPAPTRLLRREDMQRTKSWMHLYHAHPLHQILPRQTKKLFIFFSLGTASRVHTPSCDNRSSIDLQCIQEIQL
jgi:hypothetical protein